MSLFHGVHEVRLFRPNGVCVGYFDNREAALRAVDSEPLQYKAAYFTLNPIKLPAGIPLNPQALTPSRNAAGASDIERRVWLLIDCDPPRPAKTNSTAEEKQAAREEADHIKEWLRSHGWPEPVLADSGNGWHLLYRIDLPNDEASTSLIGSSLARLKQIFPMTDAGNFDSSRLCKLYGSWARKGEHSQERPWRRSAIVEAGSGGIVTESQLRNLAPMPDPAPQTAATVTDGDLAWLIGFLECYEVALRSEPEAVPGGWRVEIECPWKKEHSDENPRDTVVSFIGGRGYGFCCKHSHCVVQRHWPEFRAEVERLHPDKHFLFTGAEDIGAVTIGEAQTTEVEKVTRPRYADEVWEGTIAYEFARLCTAHNNIPAKLFIEAFRPFLAAAWGDRVRGPYRGMESARALTAILAPAGKGKGEATRTSDDFFAGMKEMIVGYPTPWRPKGIGATNAAFSSVPGLSSIIAETKKFQETSPHLTWHGTIPRVIIVQEELKSFLSSLFIEGGVGTDLEGVICALWDGVRFHSKATAQRQAAYGAVQLSLLGGIPPNDWFELLGQGDIISSGFYSRLNIIGTEGEYQQVARIRVPDLQPLQDVLLPRLEDLANTPYLIEVDPRADAILDEWVKALPPDSVRLNIHVLRTAMVLAWLRNLKEITPAVMEGAIQLGNYQVNQRKFYRVTCTRNVDAAIEAQIKKYLGTKGPASKWAVGRGINYTRHGVSRFESAWLRLVKAGIIVPVNGNDARFGLATGQEW
jgi:hypothetical protein